MQQKVTDEQVTKDSEKTIMMLQPMPLVFRIPPSIVSDTVNHEMLILMTLCPLLPLSSLFITYSCKQLRQFLIAI